MADALCESTHLERSLLFLSYMAVEALPALGAHISIPEMLETI
jgi:hypothetical protein